MGNKNDDYLDKIIRNALKDTAKEIHKQIQLAYENSVKEFYDDYTPDYYKRTYSTYQGSSSWEGETYPGREDILSIPKGFFGNTRNTYFESGINVDGSQIQGDPYKFNKRKKKGGFSSVTEFNSFIFYRTFALGFHGYASRMRTKNGYVMSKFAYRKSKSGKYMKYKFISRMKKQSGNYMINNSPQKIMDKEFKNICKGIDAILEEKIIDGLNNYGG